MKNILIFVFLMALLNSCGSYHTSVNAVKSYPPIIDNNKILILDEKKHTLPDSAEYVGTLSSTNYFGYSMGIGMAAMYFLPALGGDVPNGIGIAVATGAVVVGLDSYLFDANERNTITDAAKEIGGNLVLITKHEKMVKDHFSSLEAKVFRVPKQNDKSGYTKESLLAKWKNGKLDKLEGIYVCYLDEVYKNGLENEILEYAIVKEASQYKVIYLSGFENLTNSYTLISDTWDEGDIVGTLNSTDKASVFSGTFCDFDKFPYSNTMAKYDQGNLYINTTQNLFRFNRTYPESAQYKEMIGSLTGFAISGNKIMTCFHGVSDLEVNPQYKMFVTGINGNFDEKYQVIVEKTDRANDMAVLRLLDTNIKFNVKPYSPLQSELAISKEVFVLGYPLSTAMGEELKLSNGIISSLTGYAGNLNNYQITAPIQPGNSGSPAFDGNGNLIGMITSSVKNTDNVAYTLKFNSLKQFLEKNKYDIPTTSLDATKDLNLNEKVNHFKNNIFLIEMVNTKKKKKS